MNHNEKDKNYTYLNKEIERDHNDGTNETKQKIRYKQAGENKT